LLYFAFKSVKQGLLIFSAIPLSAIGGIFALALLGLPFSISAGVGFIALFGVAVLNGIVLIAEFNRIQKEGITDLKETVLIGTKIRMRPVLMTAFVASLGFLPMAMSHGAGAEVQRPLASVVIGGLLLATFLTLFVLPILYILFTKTSKRSIVSKNLATILVIVLVTNFGNAQQTITYKAAIDSAIANNLNYKNEKLKVEYQKQLTQTALALTPTDVNYEFGRLNSRYLDNRLSIKQTIDFPLVYARKKQVFKEDWDKASFQSELKLKTLKNQVGISYYSLIVLAEKHKLLLVIDSIYSEYLQKAELRIRTGETNILEKITIENQRIQIGNQLKQLTNAIWIEQLHFQYLLNTQSKYLPVNSESKILLTHKYDKTMIGLHPSIKMVEADVHKAIAQLNLEKSKLIPTINFGVVSGTMYGYGADNNFYTHTSRFTAGQIGLLIPVFSKQGKQVKLATLNNQIVQNTALSERLRIQNEFEGLLKQYETQNQIIAELENKALPNATLIFETAQKQFVNGEIDYLEWAILINQSISIQSDYQDALMKYNELAIQISNL
jgi:cobalt-zinc-cadmium resistance protein CzcA